MGQIHVPGSDQPDQAQQQAMHALVQLDNVTAGIVNFAFALEHQDWLDKENKAAVITNTTDDVEEIANTIKALDITAMALIGFQAKLKEAGVNNTPYETVMNGFLNQFLNGPHNGQAEAIFAKINEALVPAEMLAFYNQLKVALPLVADLRAKLYRDLAPYLSFTPSNGKQ